MTTTTGTKRILAEAKAHFILNDVDADACMETFSERYQLYVEVYELNETKRVGDEKTLSEVIALQERYEKTARVNGSYDYTHYFYEQI